jgi:hypothetical protein
MDALTAEAKTKMNQTMVEPLFPFPVFPSTPDGRLPRASLRRTFPPRNLGGKFAFGLDFTTPNVFAYGANVIAESLRVICAVAVDFPNNRIFHNLLPMRLHSEQTATYTTRKTSAGAATRLS